MTASSTFCPPGLSITGHRRKLAILVLFPAYLPSSDHHGRVPTLASPPRRVSFVWSLFHWLPRRSSFGIFIPVYKSASFLRVFTVLPHFASKFHLLQVLPLLWSSDLASSSSMASQRTPAEALSQAFSLINEVGQSDPGLLAAHLASFLPASQLMAPPADDLVLRFMFLNPEADALRAHVPPPTEPTLPLSSVVPAAMRSLDVTTAQARRKSGEEDSSNRLHDHHLTDRPERYSTPVWLAPCTLVNCSMIRLIHAPDHFRAFIMIKAATFLFSTDYTKEQFINHSVAWFDNVFSIEQWCGNGTNWGLVQVVLTRFSVACILVRPGRGRAQTTQILGVPLPPDVQKIHDRASSYSLPLTGFRSRLDASFEVRSFGQVRRQAALYYAVLARMIAVFAPSYIMVSRSPDGKLRFRYLSVERIDFDPVRNVDRFFTTICLWASDQPDVADIRHLYTEIAPDAYGQQYTAYRHFLRSPGSYDLDPTALTAVSPEDAALLFHFLIRADE